MSLGVHVLSQLVAQAVAALADWDIEIVETHHRAKVDAPSGTALRLAEAAQRGARRRDAAGPRAPGPAGRARRGRDRHARAPRRRRRSATTPSTSSAAASASSSRIGRRAATSSRTAPCAPRAGLPASRLAVSLATSSLAIVLTRRTPIPSPIARGPGHRRTSERHSDVEAAGARAERGRTSNRGRAAALAVGSGAASPLWSPTTSQMPVPASTAPTPGEDPPERYRARGARCSSSTRLCRGLGRWSRATPGVQTSVTLFGTLLRSWSLAFLSESHPAPSMPAATRKPTPTATAE